MTEIEMILNERAKNRNTETLRNIYDRAAGSASHRLMFRDQAHEVIDRVGEELLNHSKFDVQVLPASLVFNPYNQKQGEHLPVIVTTHMIRTLDITNGKFNVDELSAYLLQHYFQLLIEKPERVPTVINLYDLVVPTDIVTDPQSGQERVGFMTRYAKHRFDRPSVNLDKEPE